jgi:UDP-N-acetylglucosamine--N-acetylmuramyl-(pentapeptide) pyrophosphoryl-undecaprenol N-acetylglucosamine transferase
VAYEGMERYFPKSKIVFTGNPVRDGLEDINRKKELGYKHFELQQDIPVILILGGSLGAKTINESVWNQLELVSGTQIQFIWQTGKFYFNEAQGKIEGIHLPHLRLYEFIHEMDLAFAVADLVISRAGAGTISELCIVGKPAILVPSRNVAEDHQTKNAEALARKEAALIVRDEEAEEKMIEKSLEVIRNPELLSELAANIGKMAVKNSATRIAEEILKLTA